MISAKSSMQPPSQHCADPAACLARALEHVDWQRRNGFTLQDSAAAIGLTLTAKDGWDAVTWGYARSLYAIQWGSVPDDR